MANDDEILTDYVALMKTQNEGLQKQLAERPRSILGVSEMWIAFWNTIGGMWKDFWVAISAMWTVLVNDENTAIGFAWGVPTVLIVAIISIAIVMN